MTHIFPTYQEDLQSASAQLSKYKERFEANPFEPFPSMDALIESIGETIEYVLTTQERVAFLETLNLCIERLIEKELGG